MPAAFAGLSRSLPALAYADEMQERAASLGYDWPDLEGVIDKIAEEATELLAADRRRRAARGVRRPAVRPGQPGAQAGHRRRGRAAGASASSRRASRTSSASQKPGTCSCATWGSTRSTSCGQRQARHAEDDRGASGTGKERGPHEHRRPHASGPMAGRPGQLRSRVGRRSTSRSGPRARASSGWATRTSCARRPSRTASRRTCAARARAGSPPSTRCCRARRPSGRSARSSRARRAAGRTRSSASSAGRCAASWTRPASASAR